MNVLPKTKEESEAFVVHCHAGCIRQTRLLSSRGQDDVVCCLLKVLLTCIVYFRRGSAKKILQASLLG